MWVIAALTAWPGVGTGSMHGPLPAQSAVALHESVGFAWQRPMRVTTMLASTSTASAASTLPEIVPVMNGMRAASAVRTPSETARTSLRSPA
jgi:hypothetical protein